MSYPPPRYHGDSGEVSASFRPVSHPAELTNASGGGAHYLATGASTGGEFGLYRWDMGPGPGGPDAHFHRTISESFFVLSGTVRLYDYFETLADAARREAMDDEQRAEFFVRHDTYWV